MIFYNCKHSLFANFIELNKKKEISKLNEKFIEDINILLDEYIQKIEQKEEEYKKLEMVRIFLERHLRQYQKNGYNYTDLIEYLRLYI
jgi:molybdopterin converting factor small subunit